MVEGVISGSNEFRDFAADIETIKQELPEARRRAVKKTAKDFRQRVVNNVRKGGTSKGGTLDSRTSPYSPGTTNDSSDDNQHLSDIASWNIDTIGDSTAVVTPNEEMRKRAYWMEYGTSSHGPSGDTPMFFDVGNATIVVAEPPSSGDDDYKDWTSAMFSDETSDFSAMMEYGEPGEVEGVDPNFYFDDAATKLRSDNAFKKHLRDEMEELFDKHLG